ncbi:MAG: hypothetical protein PHU44_13550 [Syntrophales bacterium]|nr:hypothetical protein [Syntrophales bacterium]MDD5641894.1 hypothetical protein [Syntrophales bacterium]
MTTKFVGASGKNGREREVIPVPEGMTEVKAVMAFFQCDRRTARVSMARGYYIVNYHRRSICPGDLDNDAVYRLAWLIYRRKYQDRLPWYVAPEDLIQEGVLRLLEMAGHPRFHEKGFQFYLALNAMKGWIERQRRLRGGINGTTPGYEETWRPDAWSSWQTAWQAKREEAPQKTKRRLRSGLRSPEAVLTTIRQIHEAAGKGVSKAGLGRRLGVSPRGAGRKAPRAMEAGLAENAGAGNGCKGQAIRFAVQGRDLVHEAA